MDRDSGINGSNRMDRKCRTRGTHGMDRDNGIDGSNRMDREYWTNRE